jgi:hypothetical protein
VTGSLAHIRILIGKGALLESPNFGRVLFPARGRGSIMLPTRSEKKEEITRKDNGVASHTWYIVPTFSRNGFVRFPFPYDANFPRRRPAQGFAQW